MPVSGELCASEYGWQSVYYLQGGITLLSFIVFYFFYRDSPQIHKNVSQKELIKITSGKCLVIYTNGKKQHQPVPYWEILKDISVWGIFISCFGGTFGFQILSQYGPTYLNKVLGFDLVKTGFAAAFPFILSICFKLIAAPFSDRFTLISQKARIIMFNSLAQFPMSICLILLAEHFVA
uniref:MFS transporter n=1 Tax=Panagrolaimus superbus TaxID=310955 RepID=A0A914YXZ8_9BILA